MTEAAVTRHARHATHLRRPWVAGLAVVSTAMAMGLLGAGAAQAVVPDPGVSATGEFQLDNTYQLNTTTSKNGTTTIDTATSGTQCDPDAAAVQKPTCPVTQQVTGDDWDTVQAGTSSATATKFITDPVNAGTTTNPENLFTGGGSKDPNDISSWLWSTGSGVQDKNDIEHAYAARYTGTSTFPYSYLFFGLDRYATAGDAALGFWFLQDQVAPTSTVSNGGMTFSGVHKEGDVLVQINYTTGGAQPSVQVSKWHLGALDVLQTSNSLCGQSGSQNFCASTNLQNEAAPWAFNLKGTGDSSTFAGRTFFEGGIDLTSFGLDNKCYSTFLAETRSSQSFTSTLSDFALGQFAPCKATITTTPDAGVTSTTSVSPGTAVTDTATITGSGLATPPFPNSSATAPGTGKKVNFYLCGRTDTTSTSTCTDPATATSVPLPGDLTPSATTQGVSTATSGQVNTAANPLAPGRYCWLATWAGDQNYIAPTTPGYFADTNASSECFVVRTIGTATVTTPSDSSGTALSGAQALGTVIYDKAVVTATSPGGGDITGNVAFFLCDPTHTVNNVCPAGAGAAVGNPSVTPVSGATPNPQSTALSNGTHANLAGTWCYRATFTATGSTYENSGDTGNASECVVISKAPTGTTTTPTLLSGSPVGTTPVAVGTSVYDHAVVSSTNPAAGPPTGNVHFYVCDPSHLVAGVCSSGGTDLGTAGLTASGNTASANSPNVVANQVGTWCFRGEYGGDSNYLGSSDSSVTECFAVKDTTTATSTQNWLPNDHAVITSTASNTTVSGVINLTLYPTGDCKGTAVSGQSYSSPAKGASGHLSGTHSISFDSSNTTFKVSTPDTTNWSWLVTFTSDDESTVASSTHCESTSMTITN